MREQLEAAIDDDPYDIENYRVLADSLEGTGDPRGQLINMHLLRERLTERGKQLHLEKRTDQYFAEHGAAFLGPLRKWCGADLKTPAFEWRWGFIHKVKANDFPGTKQKLSHLVATLVSHPSARFLAELDLGAWSTKRGQEVVDAIDRPLPALRSLRLTCGDDRVELTKLWPNVPRLATLALSGVFALGTVALPMLTTLELSCGIDLADVQLPALERLDFDCFADDGVLASIRRVFDRDDLPKLRRVYLVDASLPKKQIDALRALPLGKQLVTLEKKKRGM